MWSNFETSQSMGGGFLGNSQAEPSGKTEPKRGQKLFPVMIVHLNNLKEDLEIRGHSLPIFTFIGIVRKIQRVTTKITYHIEDETGSIVAHLWLEADDEKAAPKITENRYARVYGVLRKQGDQPHIMILRIWSLQSMNELTSHLLEVTYIMLKAKKMSGEQQSDSTVPQNQNVLETEAKFISGMTPEQHTIFQIIHAENNSESGISRETIKQRAPINIKAQIDNILEFLACEGHIYTTCTEDQFKTT
ncbi:replication factor A protein 2-like [Cephus cinctus]|uniref:Replication factor A protein 2-like n=1 Tax=Cephus cinctus TaxID=211228 RepID=A0AAJ7BUR2_CEPCN|nr:replication factor A protein 2-like [Cephus cinctus]